MKVQHLIVLLAVIAFTAQAQICQSGVDFPVNASSICKVPGGISCCPPETENIFREIIEAFREALPAKCADVYTEYFCGACMPGTFVDNGLPCRSFCKRLISACGGGFEYDGDLCDSYPDTYCYNGMQTIPLPPRKICGQFGDPHIVTFDRKGFTCGGANKNVTLVKTSKFHLKAYNEKIPGAEATVTKALYLYVKSENSLYDDIDVVFTPSNIRPYIDPDHTDIRHLSGFGTVSNYIITVADTRLQITSNRDSLTFGIATPDAGDANSWCSAGCPVADRIDVSSFIASKRSEKRDEAETACGAKFEKTSFEYEACVFDYLTVGDDTYLEAAESFQSINKQFESEEAARKHMRENSASTLAITITMALIPLLAMML